MNLLKNGLALFVLILFAVACGSNEEFATNKNKDVTSVAAVKETDSVLYSNSTLIKPPVDFLFLWDNSGSQNFMSSSTKSSLLNTINLISSRFDYHILMAPLLPTDGQASSLLYSSIIATNPSDISASVFNTYGTSYDQAVSRLTTMPSAGGVEKGLVRTIELLKNNQSNGVFRKNAYTIIVMMSNGDDKSYITGSYDNAAERSAYIATKKAELLTIRNSQLNSLMFRFMSMVPHSVCSAAGINVKTNYVYKTMSAQIYQTPVTNVSAPTDQSGRSTPDSYDVCGSEYSSLFAGINNAIQEVVIKHRYNYWPVASANTESSINVSKIRVWKGIFGSSSLKELTQSSSDGFEWYGCSTTLRPTRYYPTVGEPYAGCMLKLNGSAEVTYPEYLKVVTEAPVEYYGYIQLSSQPVVSSIKVEINGKLISESTSNGWKAIGYVASQNTKVTSPSNDTPAYPAVTKSGYFLKLYGSAVYSNGDTVKVIYDPQANK